MECLSSSFEWKGCGGEGLSFKFFHRSAFP